MVQERGSRLQNSESRDQKVFHSPDERLVKGFLGELTAK